MRGFLGWLLSLKVIPEYDPYTPPVFIACVHYEIVTGLVYGTAFIVVQALLIVFSVRVYTFANEYLFLAVLGAYAAGISNSNFFDCVKALRTVVGDKDESGVIVIARAILPVAYLLYEIVVQGNAVICHI